MSIRTFATPRPLPLAACLLAALGLAASGARGANALGPEAAARNGSFPAPKVPSAAGKRAPHTSSVSSCADDGMPGTLRYEIINAPSGGTIDLSSLACSTITLDGSWPITELDVIQYSLYLDGPSDHHLTIDGGHHSRVFKHLGGGTLGIRDLTITNAYYVSGTQPRGGCIYSANNVVLTRSVVSHCILGGLSSEPPRGGGVYTKGSLTLSTSSIVRNKVASAGSGSADGGAAFVFGDFHAYYSSISDNAATAKYQNTHSTIGGVHALSNVTIQGSTISGNVADFAGAIGIDGSQGHMATITNSTISDNVANLRFGGIFTNVALDLVSSTIAFNTARASGAAVGAGLYTSWLLTMKSSIIADNASENGPSDLGLGGSGAIVADVNNLVTSSNVPAGTLHGCPKLQPLLNNGGTTLTHALSSHTEALDEGYNPDNLATDQRFAPRVAGTAADIGSVEWQPGETDERVFVAGFDGVCDR